MTVSEQVYSNPGEFLNILEVLPYLKQNGIIVMHDTAQHTLSSAASTTNCICLNTLHGKRIILSEDTSRKCPVVSNIGGIVLGADIHDMYYPLFTNLSLPWTYVICEEDYSVLLKHYRTYYSPELAGIFERAYSYYVQQYMPVVVRFPFIRRRRDETHHYFKIFGFTLKIKRGNKGLIRRLAEKFIGE